MAIFRGTGGSGNSTDDSIVSAVTEQAGIATTKAGEAATSATTATTKASEASASATTASTKATEANTAKNLAEDARNGAQAYRDTALQAASTAGSHATAAEASAQTANNSSVQTVAGISTEVQNVNNIRTEIQNVDTIKTDVTTVAGISSNVTTVAADASDIGTVATNITNVNNVGDNIANVNAVHSNASNINTVAADASDIGTVSSNISNVNTVAGISSDVTTVAGLESKMDTVIADASDIGAVANNIGDVTTVAGINSDVDTVAGIAAKVTTVADNITDVQNADTNAANASASASQAANSASAAGASASTASTKATEASNSATAASNSATTATTKATEAAGSATTATNKATEASTSATNAATSATTATTKAGEAASSATAASGSATTATTKASEADASANSAASSATDATNASNTWSNFYTTYLGAADAPPTVDVQGNALQTGAFYYDTGAGSNTVGLYVYNGSSWVYSTNYNNVTAPYSLAQDLATNGNDISFGDNAKAQFGASNDLQIYHNGTNSFVSEVGSGDLKLNTNGASVILQKNTGEPMVKANTDSSVDLYYDNAKKLATTSTGIDVTGTATMDGLTVDGEAYLGAEQANPVRINSSSAVGILEFNSTTGVVRADGTGQLLFETGGSTDRLKIANNGDISFYEDTGTTPKFFWDASAERLGIGTTSPLYKLHVSGAVGITDGTSTATHALVNGNYYIQNTGAYSTIFQGNSTERMRIDASGNVGIGTTAPSSKLTASSTGQYAINTINPTSTANNKSGISFYGYNSQSAPQFYGGISANFDNTAGGAQSGSLVFETINTNSISEKMRITPSGNVGIGTDNPAANLHVSNGSSGATVNSNADDLIIESATNAGISILGDGNETQYLMFGDAANSAIGRVLYDHNTNHMALWTNANERMRLTSSGKLLIGKTDESVINTVGIEAHPAGLLVATRDNNIPLIANRKTTQGVIAQFRNDNTVVGSIGNSSTRLFAGSGATGLMYDGSNNYIVPWNTSSNTGRDGAIDLGVSSFRFKDLYLSNKVFANYIGAGGDTDTYMRFAGSNQTIWVNGGSEAMRITSSGNVGIGTTNPPQLLTVGAGTATIGFVPDATNGSYIRVGGTGTGSNVLRILGHGNAEKVRFDGSGNVGIGTTSPDTTLDVHSSTNGHGIYIAQDNVGYGYHTRLTFQGSNGSGGYNTIASLKAYQETNGTNGYLRFDTNGDNERMRIDSSGNLLVGKTANDNTTVGFKVENDGFFSAVADGNTTCVLNRLTSDGEIAIFRKDNATVGSIGTGGGDLNIGTGDTRIRFNDATDNIIPLNASNGYRDNAISIGDSTARFKDIYRSGSTYSTSDRNKKQDIRDLTDAEARVAVVAKGSLKAFRYIDTVEAEGDDANIHFGIIAQDLKAAFEAEGLNANNYQVLKTSTYTDDDGVEQTTYSVCYENLLAFIISAI